VEETRLAGLTHGANRKTVQQSASLSCCVRIPILFRYSSMIHPMKQTKPAPP